MDEVILRIPASLAHELEQKIKGSRYRSVQDYVLDLIRQTLEQNWSFSKEDEKRIRQRLSRLGYE